MTVDRFDDTTAPATLSIFFAPIANASAHSATASPAPTTSTSGDKTSSEHTPWEKVEAVDMKHRRSEEILERLLEITKAQRVFADADEQAEMTRLEEQRQRSEQVREQMMAHNEKVRQERELLEQARGELA